MMSKKQKLELTWIGKENRPRLEPRILLEDPEKSYHAKQRVSDKDIFDNRLIFGDNLLALKALEQEFAGAIKCVYIDPPFNTGEMFEHYDDGVEHSLWLTQMRDRLTILHRLLANGYKDFDLDCSSVHYPTVAKDLLVQRLTDNQRFRIISGDGVGQEARLEDYIVRGLIDKDDISYDDHAVLLYKLAGQLVRHLQSYLPTEDDVRNVLQYNQSELVRLVHTQMNQHYIEKATEYQVTMSKGFQTLTSSSAEIELGKSARDFRHPVEEKLLIRGMVFGGFKKCLYPAQKFDSDTERRFATILEDDADVVKWLKPPKDVLKIHYAEEDNYLPDFIVETHKGRFLCEIKRATDVDDAIVQKKAKAAIEWCGRASTISDKPWKYSLLPHDQIQLNRTFLSLVQL